jgi:hypothetical protein
MKLILFSCLFSCVTLLPSPGFADVGAAKTERILGYRPMKSGVIFQVTSGGCTHKADFAAEVLHPATSDYAELTLMRVRPDPCYPFVPMGERLKFSYDELGLKNGERFIVKNPNGVVEGWIWDEANL